jgi:hypothetical protein
MDRLFVISLIAYGKPRVTASGQSLRIEDFLAIAAVTELCLIWSARRYSRR